VLRQKVRTEGKRREETAKAAESMKALTSAAARTTEENHRNEIPTSPMDADRPKNLGGRVMGAPRWVINPD